ncbi:Acetyltransferase, GNAT family [Cyanobacterium stanieri PCC 7202]|uniref:Acetyltransferase, GNAT family n=1 Tax=Cyanobacterium stanieri (strain ATCC 29140 / PCC 7202) TaxID=292563 RepID=K9YM53_CYASC|nr:Acetyltransferase, GNAT family [Cyanobacterium stanieri PCC 7202]
MFRLISTSDFVRVQKIYQNSVLKLAPSLYSPEQVMAWSLFPNNIQKFYSFVFNPDTYVIENKEEIIGFCGLEKDGHIASLYVDPSYNRQGYGTKLLQYVLEQGIKAKINRFYTEASFFSHPVFLRCGFVVLEMETVKYGVVSFQRYKMEKEIIE